MIYERTHSREIADNSALGMVMPIYVTFLGIFCLSSLAFPGTNSFVGEFLVLFGAFKKSVVVGFLAIPGAILAAAYMLRLLQRMVWHDSDGHAHHHDEADGDVHAHKLTDLSFRELSMVVVLAIFVFWIGLYPAPLLKVMDASVTHLLHQISAGGSVVPVDPHGGHHALLELGNWCKQMMTF